MERKEKNTESTVSGQSTINCTYTAVTPCHFTVEKNEFSLYKDHTYDLPNVPFVQSLIAQERLKKN